MPKKIVGIAASEKNQFIEGFTDSFLTYTPKNFVTAIQKVGGIPIILPMDQPNDAKVYIDSIDCLLLAGGSDVTPVFYQEEPHPKLGGTNFNRDLFEEALIAEALKQNKPILGVCRGMQILNVTLGGSLYQDLSLYSDWAVKHDQMPSPSTQASHSITTEEESHIRQIVGANYQVNSYHHQAIKRVATSLKPVAWSTDNLIEALESKNPEHRILGVQWHPELTFKDNVTELAIFDYFVNQL